MTVDGCQETSREMERSALAATCPRCHQQGFAYKQSRSLD
jgi:Zn finger protein HypA/HybF involved in hydrogenase expression